MLIQGSNVPLTIKFDAAVDTLDALVITLWCDQYAKTPLKVWTLDDMTVSNDTAVCELAEEETAKLPNFPNYKCIVEAKGLDSNGETVFWDAAEIDVKERRDKVIKLTGA